MVDSVKRTWRIIRGYLYEKTFSKMLFMLFSRTFMMFGIGLITVPAMFLFFYEALQKGDVPRVCCGTVVFCVYVVWIIWGDKNRMVKYNRLFFLSEIRIHKSYVEKLVNIPYGEWRKEYDVGSAVNLIENGTDEVMDRFRDVISLAFKGTAVLLINLWIFMISSMYVVVLINIVIIIEFCLSSYLSQRIATCEKRLFDSESIYKNMQRMFIDCTEDYAMAGLGDYWKDKILENTSMKYKTEKKISNLNSLLQSGMDFIDLFMYLGMFLYGLDAQGSMLSPLVIIMAYEMIKDVTGDFISSMEKIQKKFFAVDEFEKIDQLTVEVNETTKGFDGICLRDVEVEKDGKILLSEVNLAILPGEKVLIVGDNGSGKTMLLKTILGINESSKGEVRYGDKSPGKICSRTRSMLVAYNPVERMLFPATIAENLNLYAEGQGYGAEELKKRLWELLGREYDVGEEIEDAKSYFSLGQIDTLCMLRTEKSEGSALVLDEPLAHADKTIFHLIWQELMESNRTVIAVEHEFDDVAKEFNPIIVWMDGGRIKAIEKYMNLIEQNEEFRNWRKGM